MAIALTVVFLLIWVFVVLWIRSRGLSTEQRRSGPENLETVQLQVGDAVRSYHILNRPGWKRGDKPTPVIIAFHGGGGGGERFARNSQLPSAAFAQGMSIIFADAAGRWADGRSTTRENWDEDLMLVRAILDRIEQDPKLDSKFVFIAGISNGAMFCVRLGCELGSRLRGLAMVSGAIPEEMAHATADGPIPVLMVNATNDHLIPMRGGPLPTAGGLAAGGRILNNDKSAAFWQHINRCEDTPTTHKIKIGKVDADVRDHRGGDNGADLTVVTLHNAGHNWPEDRLEGTISLEQLVIRFFQRQMKRYNELRRSADSGAEQKELNQGSLPT